MTTYFNHCGFSDVEPYEVIKEVSSKTVIIRKMKCELLNKDKLNWETGGFSAICTNQSDQDWKISSDPSSTPFRIRLHKDGTWKDPYGDTYIKSTKPVKFYDFNF